MTGNLDLAGELRQGRTTILFPYRWVTGDGTLNIAAKDDVDYLRTRIDRRTEALRDELISLHDSIVADHEQRRSLVDRLLNPFGL